jgi:PAS domain S-box-containing protein
MAMAVAILPMLLATAFAFFSQKEQINRSLVRELNASLAACKLYYHNLEERLDLTTRATANDNTCKTTLRLGVLPQLQQQLDILAREYEMDFLLATDITGRVVALYPPPADSGADLSHHPLIIQALNGKATTIPMQEDHPLLVRATGGPEKQQQKTELLLESAHPITIRDTQIGALLAGVRLSGNTRMMTAMQQASGADHTTLVMNGKAVASSSNHDCHVPDPHFDLLPGKKMTTAGNSLPTSTCPLDGKLKVFTSTELSGLNGEPVATLFTVLNYDRAGMLIKNAVLGISITFAVAMLIAAAITYFVARSIALPVNRLSQAMGEMETGTLSLTPLPVNRNDEIGLLIQGFNTMTTQIQTYTHGLENEILERIKAEKSLAEEKERLAVTLRSIGDAVITTDTRGNIVFINKMGEELTGWSNTEAQGQPITTILPLIDEKTGLPRASLAQVVLETAHMTTHSGHSTLVTRDGIMRSIADSGAPILDLNNKMIGAVIVFRDITDTLKMENELQKIKKLEAIGILAGGIAHDFNNSLAAIMGYIEVAAARIAKKDEDAALLLAQARESIMWASTLTKQLLTFSKGGSPVKDSASLPKIIRDSVTFVLHGSNVASEYHFPEDLWLAEVDSGQFSQVIQNIIINAKHAMPAGGKVVISGANINNPATEALLNVHDGYFVKITIKDTGGGIPPEIIDRIFDPYFTTKETGNGLGLAICHSIIRKHNGYLTVQSEPGQGATFIIYLPASPVAAISTRAIKQLPESPATSIASARIMVIDDEQILRDIVKAQLAALGHEAVLAADGAEGVRIYQELRDAGTPVDLVITDLTIPGGMGGKEAAQILLQKDPKARLIVSSGYSDDPVMANFRDYGFRAAMTKPFTMESLQQAIKQAFQS